MIKAFISFALPLLAGAIGSVFTTSEIGYWYAKLNKPSFNPPNWIFGPVWTTLYILMGYAWYRAWKAADAAQAKTIAIVFIAQLILNSLWSIVFFRWHSPDWAVVVILALLFAIGACFRLFYPVDHKAAWLLLPYYAWVLFATVLNIAIWNLNK